MDKFTLYKLVKAVQPILAVLFAALLFGLFFADTEVMSGGGVMPDTGLGSVYMFAYGKTSDTSGGEEGFALETDNPFYSETVEENAANADATVKAVCVCLLLFAAYSAVYAVVNAYMKYSRRFEYSEIGLFGVKALTKSVMSVFCYPLYIAVLVCAAVGVATVNKAGFGMIVPGAGLVGALSVAAVCLSLTLFAEAGAVFLHAFDGDINKKYSASSRKAEQAALRSTLPHPARPPFGRPLYPILAVAAKRRSTLGKLVIFTLPLALFFMITFIINLNDPKIILGNVWGGNGVPSTKGRVIYFIFGALSILFLVALLIEEGIAAKRPPKPVAKKLKNGVLFAIYFLALLIFVVYQLYYYFMVYGDYEQLFKALYGYSPEWYNDTVVENIRKGGRMVFSHITAMSIFVFQPVFGYSLFACQSLHRAQKALQTEHDVDRLRAEYENSKQYDPERAYAVYDYQMYKYEHTYKNKYGEAVKYPANPSLSVCSLNQSRRSLTVLLCLAIVAAITLCLVIPAYV